MKEVNNTQGYDPEVEKEAIAAEEAYKQKNGHYREGSAYNNAKKEKAEKGTANDGSTKSNTNTGVRKDLNGNVIGEYKMR